MRYAWVGAAILAGCSGGYTVTVDFEPDALADQARVVELALIESCDTQPLGDAPDDVFVRMEYRRGDSAGLGDVDAGQYGLYARARGADCRVIAAGCIPVTLKKGGGGELVVVAAALDGAGCRGSEICDDGECRPGDAGNDGGSDVGIDAPMCMCAACADCVDGACVPVQERCGATEYCDVVAGCRPGTPCVSGACEDDGNPCTAERCDDSRDPPLCLSEPVADTTACDDGGPGRCFSGACCTGCWDGGSCVGGDTATACGNAGGDCSTCECPRAACVSGSCDLPAPVVQIESGEDHNCAIDTSGRIWCWGDNSFGQLGLPAGVPAVAPAPTLLPDPGPWVDVGGGELHVCAVDASGGVGCWGDNEDGQLGRGDRLPFDGVSRVVGLDDGATVFHGTMSDHSCVVSSTGTLRCAGEDQYGQIGNGPPLEPAVASFTAVALTNWSSGAMTDDASCGLRAGELWCWGRNVQGELGVGDLVLRDAPTRVGSATDWDDVRCGEYHCCGRRGTDAYCWGDNVDGQLGVGDVVDRSSPVALAGAWRMIDPARDHTCGIQTDGSLWCWGENTQSQLGLGAPSSRETSPMQVGVETSWVDVSGGEAHTCAVDGDGLVWCFGSAASGQLGTGGFISLTTPAPVCFPSP